MDTIVLSTALLISYPFLALVILFILISFDYI